MMASLDPAHVDACLANRAGDVIHALTLPDGRVRPEVLATNWPSARRALARQPVFDETGRWTAIDAATDEAGHGLGATALLAWVARIEPARAAAYLMSLGALA